MPPKTVKVLLIEDDADDAAILKSHLTGAGPAFEVKEAARLSTASHLLDREGFDAVIIDLALAECVGLEGVRKVRAQKPDLPVVVLTGLKDEALAAEAVSLGAQDYLIKGSVDCCALKRAVRHAIERKRLLVALERAGAPSAPRGPSPKPASAAKDASLGRVSHELRNALATVKTAVFCLSDQDTGPLTVRQQRLVEMISRNVDRQVRIVENILDLSRLKAGTTEVDFRPVALGSLAEELAAEFRLKDKTRRLILDLEEALPPAAGDADLLLQLLRNLLDNAFRYAKNRVVLKAGRASDGGLALSVIDDGPGIPAARLRDLFTDFVQLDRPKGPGYRGTGLGLSICREIVDNHRGRIWAESGSPQGARFHVALRAFAGADGAAAPRDGAVTGPSKMIHPAEVGPGPGPRL